MNGDNDRPVSPINGVPLPRGKPFEPGDEQRERSRKAGKKSGQARAARKTLREELLSLLTVKVTSGNGKKMQTQTAMSAALIKQAISGNTRAYEIIRDTIGEKPVENVSLITGDFSALDEAFKNLAGEEE